MTAEDIQTRYATERSADGRDAILTEAIETFGPEFGDSLIEAYGEPEISVENRNLSQAW